MTAQWRGFYTDARGREAIVIRSDGASLTLIIRGVTFAGSDFDSFEPAASLGPDAPFSICHAC